MASQAEQAQMQQEVQQMQMTMQVNPALCALLSPAAAWLPCPY